MNITLRKSDYIKLIGICIISIVLDLFIFIDVSSPPAWDQGYHLSNLFKMYNIFLNENINVEGINEIDKENNIIHLDIPDGLLEII